MNRRRFLAAISCLPLLNCATKVSEPDLYDAGDIFVSSKIGMDYPFMGSRKHPFATVDYAISQCEDPTPCAIIIMQGHEGIVYHSGWSAVKPYKGP